MVSQSGQLLFFLNISWRGLNLVDSQLGKYYDKYGNRIDNARLVFHFYR